MYHNNKHCDIIFVIMITIVTLMNLADLCRNCNIFILDPLLCAYMVGFHSVTKMENFLLILAFEE